MEKLHVILTGATGMVGEGVLMECLLEDNVERVLIINRRSSGITHPKLTEVLHPDFFNLEPVKNLLRGYNACFFCLGVSSVGMNKDTYFRNTHTLTLNFAGLLASQNPGMRFCYISGAGTDSSEKGRIHWARVKGQTENDLMELPFKAVYNFRPAVLEPSTGQKFVLPAYKYFSWLVPMFKLLAPNRICRIAEVGRAMIRLCLSDTPSSVIEVKAIHSFAEMEIT